MIDRNHGLPVTRQCKILELSRATAVMASVRNQMPNVEGELESRVRG